MKLETSSSSGQSPSAVREKAHCGWMAQVEGSGKGVCCAGGWTEVLKAGGWWRVRWRRSGDIRSHQGRNEKKQRQIIMKVFSLEIQVLEVYLAISSGSRHCEGRGFQHELIANALQVFVSVSSSDEGEAAPSLCTAALKHTKHKDHHTQMSKFDKSVAKMYCG